MVDKMAALEFGIYCGKCLGPIDADAKRGGSVLSCGDFLCASCAQSLIAGSSCPACGKQSVRAVFLNDNLPHEVKQNVADTSIQF